MAAEYTHALARAFPNVHPREQIEWLDEHADYPDSDEEDEPKVLDTEIKHAQLLCALMHGVNQRAYKAPLHIDVSSPNRERKKMTCFGALEVRVHYACKLFLRTWKDPGSHMSLKQLKKVVGSLHFVRKCNAFKPGLEEESEVIYELMQRAMQWSMQLTGAAQPTFRPPPLDAAATPLINWKIQTLVRSGLSDKFQGRYKSARVKFERAKYEFEWVPSDEVALFLETPKDEYRDDDIEAPILNAVSTGAAAASARKTVVDRAASSEEVNNERHAQAIFPPLYAGTDPLTCVTPFRA